MLEKIKAVLFGVAVGDALGVPVEFSTRLERHSSPVREMIGYGTYNQPPGTWSDDSSLTFCLAEALCQEFNLQKVAQNFVRWLLEGFWTPYGNAFDVGNTTYEAVERLNRGVSPLKSGNTDEHSNGNGSLMRILPLLFYIHNKPIAERYELTKQVSAITHAHIRSVVACFYYLEYALHLLNGKDKFEAYYTLQKEFAGVLKQFQVSLQEINYFNRLLQSDISQLSETEIKSSGYVLHTLEASIWCLLTTNNYKDAVLKAVNLGGDTDTTGAVTGGLAGLLYGFEAIPSEWIQQLARHKDIETLAEKLNQGIYG